MKQSIVLLFSFIITLMCYVNLNAQWFDITNGLPHSRCNAIDAYDSLIATGSYTVNSSWIPDSLYLTTNGGNSWFGIPFPNSIEIGDGPIDISIKGADMIWFCTGNGKIYRTTDSGLNWQLQFYDTLMTKFMNYLEMFDEMNGMAMGDAPADDKPALFLKTTNGGMNWISQNDSELIGLWSGDIWRRVNFANIDVGYFYTFQAFPPTIYKTTNSGQDWQVINDTISCKVLNVYDENIFLSEEANAPPFGTIYRTADGGQTWESQQYNFLDWSLDIEFIPGNPSNVWCGSNSLAFSSDTGKTWIEEFHLEYNAIYDMVFTDENSGWIYAGGGGILQYMYRTTNGGHGGIVSVDDTEIDSGPERFSLEQNYPNPFNPTTIIKYNIPSATLRQSATGGQSDIIVTIKVYDVLGNEVVNLVNEEKPAGEYEIEFDATGLTSGIYFYQLSVSNFMETKKMILLR